MSESGVSLWFATPHPYGSRLLTPRHGGGHSFIPLLARLKAWQTTNGPRSRAVQLVVAIGPDVPAEFGASADAEFAVDAR